MGDACGAVDSGIWKLEVNLLKYGDENNNNILCCCNEILRKLCID